MPVTITANGKPKQADEKASIFAGRKIRSYRRSYGRWYYHPALREGRFNRWDIWAMLQDYAVQLGLLTIYSPLFSARWEVRANSKEVKTFVENTLHRFWQHDLPKVLMHYVPFGTCVAEVLYEKDPDSDQWRYAGLDDVDIDSVQALRCPDSRTLRGARVTYGTSLPSGAFLSTQSQDGMRDAQGNVPGTSEWNVIRPPKVFWCAHRALCGELFGHSTLEQAWSPWMEKVGAHGAISIRKLWAFSNAYRSCIVKYPAGGTQLRADGVLVDNQDVAREVAESLTTGAALTLPSDRDDKGNPLWEIIDPKLNGEIRGLMDYPDELDQQMMKGMGILPEVIEAADTGGGWSGRSVPLLIFLNISDMRVREILTAFDVGPSGYTTRSDMSGGVIRPLVMQNFGPKARYEIRPISLVPKPEQQGGGPGAPPGAGPDAAGGGGPPGPPPDSGGAPPAAPPPTGGNPAAIMGTPGQQPLKMSRGVEFDPRLVAQILGGTTVQLSAVPWDEAKHKRGQPQNAGQFGPGGGGQQGGSQRPAAPQQPAQPQPVQQQRPTQPVPQRAKTMADRAGNAPPPAAGQPGVPPGGQPAAAAPTPGGIRGLVKKADAAAKSILAKTKGLIDKTPGGAFMRTKAAQLKDKLESRYGKKQTALIMGAGVVAAWAAVPVGMATLGVPLWVPGSTFYAWVPFAAMAEVYNAIRRKKAPATEAPPAALSAAGSDYGSHGKPLSQQEIERLGQKAVRHLTTHWKAKQKNVRLSSADGAARTVACSAACQVLAAHRGGRKAYLEHTTAADPAEVWKRARAAVRSICPAGVVRHACAILEAGVTGAAARGAYLVASTASDPAAVYARARAAVGTAGPAPPGRAVSRLTPAHAEVVEHACEVLDAHLSGALAKGAYLIYSTARDPERVYARACQAIRR